MYAARELFVSPKINLRKVNKSGGAFNIWLWLSFDKACPNLRYTRHLFALFRRAMVIAGRPRRLRHARKEEHVTNSFASHPMKYKVRKTQASDVSTGPSIFHVQRSKVHFYCTF